MNVEKPKANYHPEEQRKWRARTAKSDHATEVIAMERAIAQRNVIELLTLYREEDEIEWRTN